MPFKLTTVPRPSQTRPHGNPARPFSLHMTCLCSATISCISPAPDRRFNTTLYYTILLYSPLTNYILFYTPSIHPTYAIPFSLSSPPPPPPPPLQLTYPPSIPRFHNATAPSVSAALDRQRPELAFIGAGSHSSQPRHTNTPVDFGTTSQDATTNASSYSFRCPQSTFSSPHPICQHAASSGFPLKPAQRWLSPPPSPLFVHPPFRPQLPDCLHTHIRNKPPPESNCLSIR